jgi:SAM-dependent methyltransferase
VRAAAVKSGPDDWDRHWDHYAESAAKNPAQAYRRRLILGLLAAGPQPRCVLDIGSGPGDLAAAILDAFPSAELVGLDVSQDAVEYATRKLPAAKFLHRDLLREGDADPAHRAWATHAVCSEVLEHVEEPARLLANAHSFLKGGCRLVVTVPGGPMSAFDRHIGHRRHFTPETLGAALEEAGFEIERTGRAGFPFFNLYRLAVLLRGRRLVDDVAHGAGTTSARAAMKIFAALFRFNAKDSPWGWQVFATARFTGPTS